jgi:DNA-directed RNA polymerase specialized sigma24 family protein
MTEREIAKALDVPAGSIGPWISRALTTMNKELS